MKKEYDRCLRCGRKLKKKEYRLVGYGAICLNKQKTEKSRILKPIF